MKRTAFSLALLVSTPASANPDCKAMADDVASQDELLKTESQEFSDRYGETSNRGMEADPDYLRRLDVLIAALRRDIDGLRWLISHHCGPATEEPNAIKSVHEMQSVLLALIVRRMDARALR